MDFPGINRQTNLLVISHRITAPDVTDLCEFAHEVGRARDELRHRMIAEAAYFRAERRGFQPGHELEDWLMAERDTQSVLQAEL